MKRCLRALVVAVVTALATVSVGAAPARADGEIRLSFDGETWGDQLRRPLFDPGFTWVPGDRATESFYVRNGGPTDATMTVAVRTSDPDQLLPDDIELTARAGGGAWVPLENGGDLTPLLSDELDQRAEVRVDLRAVFLWESTNQSMLDRLPLDLIITLVQRGTVDDSAGGGSGDDPAADPGDGNGDGLLPDTGNNISFWVVLLGAALLGSGIALVVGSRRREQLHA